MIIYLLNMTAVDAEKFGAVDRISQAKHVSVFCCVSLMKKYIYFLNMECVWEYTAEENIRD